MKFVIAILAAIASVNAVNLKEATKPGEEDWGHKFDERHYDDNHIKAKWPDSYGTKPRGDSEWCSSC